MSYVAEPYAQFVDDLLTALTGGEVRTRFRFLEEQQPFLLHPPGPVVKSTLRVFGQADGAFRLFATDRDFVLTAENAVEWKARPDGTPAADAVWPDEGTSFFANYDHRGPQGVGPRLTDRNPGSVTRLISETFGREFAVISSQLQSVYEAAFLETAGSRDLDQLVALLGLTRRDRTHATGTVVFSRSSPAPADVSIPAGTRVSTAEPPPATFETSEAATLRRGSLSVEVPIRALLPGGGSVVPAGAISVVHRPIFGIDRATNPQATRLAGDSESDDALRARARRALEGSGKATSGALVGALATLPGVREKDVRIEENHLERPGVITLHVAAPLDGEQCVRAVDLIAQTRPAGVRVLHNVDCDTPLGPLSAGENVVEEAPEADGGASPAGVEGLFFPAVVEATLLPAGERLTAAERAALKRAGEDAARAFVAEAGIGETLIYNRLVASLMSIEGVLDVTLSMYPAGAPDPVPVHRNVYPGGTLRASVDRSHGGAFTVQVGGQLVAVDVTVSLVLRGAGLLGDPVANLEDARVVVADQLAEGVATLDRLSVATLQGVTVEPESFSITVESFRVEWIDAGVRDNQEFTDPADGFGIDPVHRPWVRSVSLATP